MTELTFGLLGNLETNLKTQTLWANVCDAFAENNVNYFFLKDCLTGSDIENKKINVLFTFDRDGIAEWGSYVNSSIPLIIWGIDQPIAYNDYFNSFLGRQNFIFLSMSAQDLSVIRYNYPDMKTIFMPNAYNHFSFAENQKEKIYDIVMVDSIIDVESYESTMLKELSPDAYEIFFSIVQFALKNPEASYWDIFRYFSLVYHYDCSDYLIYLDVYNRTHGYVSAMQKLKALEKLKKYNIKIWGSPEWKQYIDGNLEYMGETTLNGAIDIFNQSKIVINIDNRFDAFSLNSSCLNAIASGALLLTNNNIQMQHLFSRVTHNIYYNPNKPEELTALIDYYLFNNSERLRVSAEYKNHVKENHTWKARIEKLLSMLN